MTPTLDMTAIDWHNKDVSAVFEFFSVRLKESDKHVQELEEKLRQSEERNQQSEERIRQLEEENHTLQEELEKRKRKPKADRSYNTREFKDYPHERTKQKPNQYGESSPATPDRHHTVDQKYCPSCGNHLSEPTEVRRRTVGDAIDGKWQHTEYVIKRRYCKSCEKQYTPGIPGVLPDEQCGIHIMAKMGIMRSLGVSYGITSEIIHMFFEKYFHKSTTIRITDKVADILEPIYWKLYDELPQSSVIYGDETGWFKDTEHWWAWVFTNDMIVFYYIAPTRSKLIPEAILYDFDGILVSDSYKAWFTVGSDHQPCLLHYFRDMCRTLEKNPTAEYKAFYDSLRDILKDAIGIVKENLEDRSAIPEEAIQKLQDKISTIINGTYTDKDCNRYVKRLKQEGRYLFNFLKYKIDYHNNKSENALRTFAKMRKTLYGSKSRRGIKTTEIITTICATCKIRGINPHTFLIDALDGKVDHIPMPKTVAAAA